FLDAAVAQRVDPQVRGDAREKRAGVRDGAPSGAEGREPAEHRLLHQVLRVPDISRETAAVAMEMPSQRRQEVEIAVPGLTRVLAQLAGQLDVIHRGVSLLETNEGRGRIRTRSVTTELQPPVSFFLDLAWPSGQSSGPRGDLSRPKDQPKKSF